MRPPQTQMYTILCCLRRPATLKPMTLSSRRPGLSLRPQQKSPIAVSVNLLLFPGGRREALDQSETQSVYARQG